MKKRTKMCFIDGNKYITFTEQEKAFYLIGIMDSILTMLYMIEPQKFHEIKDKVKNMTPSKIKNLIENYFRDNPEELQYCVASSFFYALDEMISEQ
ncbi:MAG: hypothetical protein WCV43_05830 [Candidatus Caldatribacteriota bacterium]|jgi:hypothetical protein|nr:hypothetical protein [Atribacterota bacterium]MDD3032083.1 hypothetical protein [Atribacterota bacterium]MDD3640308.1 hypothetical protein [Atribacterota bacterium]MDD4288433.1 hypothetical protein [Atribacterota bacterium]MDD4765623.1 hypothetical protein [Atribacterota bacterium]